MTSNHSLQNRHNDRGSLLVYFPWISNASFELFSFNIKSNVIEKILIFLQTNFRFWSYQNFDSQ